MFPFVASQAIALSQVKKKSSAPADSRVPQRTRKGLFSRVVDALIQSRERRAEREIERHGRWMRETPKI